ncbi:hypothetical protein [Shouchella clausii]|uniref:Uncharacterized protein n=1 Tax=Shouchella clausii TaxID=79880 RepID=A0A268NWK5_SHOCL|nr:hypothetical protein [Shouchella clausii]PAE87781.1 hypothetical protein CHH72_16765 [Shouchella clausii]
MGNWGISPHAEPKEKLKADMSDYLHGLNATGQISFDIYNEIHGFSMRLLDDMYKLGANKTK